MPEAKTQPFSRWGMSVPPRREVAYFIPGDPQSAGTIWVSDAELRAATDPEAVRTLIQERFDALYRCFERHWEALQTEKKEETS